MFVLGASKPTRKGQVMESRITDYAGSWPQVRDHKSPMVVRGIAKLYPLRATVPNAPLSSLRKAMAATGNRLAVTESPNPRHMWVWARDERDAALATMAMPSSMLTVTRSATVFDTHDGTGER